MARYRTHLIGMTIALCTAGCSVTGNPLGTATAAPRDHYDPASLNDAAVAAWSKGERGTARILLERAAVLAPQDARIRGNLGVVKGADNGTALLRFAPASASEHAVGGVTSKAPAASAIPVASDVVMTSPAAADSGIWPLK